jgi:hypothetical protein
MTTTTDEILNITRRIPYSIISNAILEDHMKVMTRNRLDLSLRSSWVPLEDFLREGTIFLESASLNMHFLFANIDAGKGFFGGQKTKIATFVSRNGGVDYEAGPVLKNLLQALTGINNIYREAGMLEGIAR